MYSISSFITTKYTDNFKHSISLISNRYVLSKNVIIHKYKTIFKHVKISKSIFNIHEGHIFHNKTIIDKETNTFI